MLVDTELLYSHAPLFEAAAICESGNRLLNTNGSVEGTLLQRVGTLYMLSISEMKSLNVLQLFVFFLWNRRTRPWFAEWTNDGRRANTMTMSFDRNDMRPLDDSK